MKRREFLALLGSAVLAQPFTAQARQTEGRRRRQTLSLTSAQRAEIWRRLSEDAMKTLVPAGLDVGEVVPNTMHLLSFARAVRKKIPAIRPYLYTLLQGQVLIVDPKTRKIVAIVGE